MKRTYPNRICWECVDRTGKNVRTGEFHPIEAVCDICKCKGVTVTPAELGHFTPEQIAKVKKEVSQLGIKGNDKLDPVSINKALTIVECTLKDKMSLWTKKVWNGIKDDFERGKPITKYDLEKLMFWFARDIEMRGDNAGDGAT